MEDAFLKTYQTNLMVDKITNGKYNTNSPHSDSMHRHNYYQIVWIEKGKGIHQVEMNNYRYEDGSLFLLPPHFLHQINYNKDVQGYVISFSDIFLETMQYQSVLTFYQTPDPHIIIPESERNMFNSEMQHLFYYFNQKVDFNHHSILKNYLHILLMKIQHFASSKETIDNKKNKRDFELLGQFITLVRQNFITEKKLSFYQDRLNLSQSSLHNLISKTTGISPAKFIEQYSLNEAARLICYSSMSIKEIGAQLGYFDNSYFTRAFKRHFKHTPISFKTSFRSTK